MTTLLTTVLTAGACVACGLASLAAQKETKAMLRATGTFEVKLTPQPLADHAADAALGRMSLRKQFHGEIEGTSTGEMLTARSPMDGSAGYVAIEHVTATLAGRKGTFVLQHSGTMTRGAQQLAISVVPDSGTGELAGLSGAMTIRIVEGTHHYEFAYAFR